MKTFDTGIWENRYSGGKNYKQSSRVETLPFCSSQIKGGGKMRRIFSKKGQSTLEYVIVLTAIVAAVIAAASVIKTKVTSSFEHAAGEMDEAVAKIDY